MTVVTTLHHPSGDREVYTDTPSDPLFVGGEEYGFLWGAGWDPRGRDHKKLRKTGKSTGDV